jgi:hypothetical protein
MIAEPRSADVSRTTMENRMTQAQAANTPVTAQNPPQPAEIPTPDSNPSPSGPQPAPQEAPPLSPPDPSPPPPENPPRQDPSPTPLPPSANDEFPEGSYPDAGIKTPPAGKR